jgi:hypothetical protein
VTGQAAWYDLRVRIEKAAPAGQAEPQFANIVAPGEPQERPDELRYGQEWSQ